MAPHKDAQEQFELPTGLLTGAAIMVAIGSLLTAVGMAVGAGAVASAVRRWISHLETPPNEMAKAHWQRARSAANAGAEAWRKSAESH